MPEFHGLLIRLPAASPWRIGPERGARDGVDRIYHSDQLYSAVSSAMAPFGWLEEWLEATARAPEASLVRLSSCFPFQGQTLFVPPPRHLWPPQAAGKVRWKSACLIPLAVVDALFKGRQLEEEQWWADPESECLLPPERGASGRTYSSAPFRISQRSAAGVDRTSGSTVAVHVTACLEFGENAGMWCLAAFLNQSAQEAWGERIRAAFRYLADTGFGGERSRGWGRAHDPQFEDPPALLASGPEVPQRVEPQENGSHEPELIENAYWLLSLYSPAASDSVDWSRGAYALMERVGRVESSVGWGAPKKTLRMISEGSVLVAGASPAGAARDVAPDGFPHAVYRAGFAVGVPVPWRGSR